MRVDSLRGAILGIDLLDLTSISEVFLVFCSALGTGWAWLGLSDNLGDFVVCRNGLKLLLSEDLPMAYFISLRSDLFIFVGAGAVPLNFYDAAVAERPVLFLLRMAP